ncbi:MAG: AsmA family protein [Bryobacteraceae bacterium]
MSLPIRRVRRAILLGLPLVLLLGLIAPYLSANRFGESIRRALETSLHRKVEMQSAGFSLFRGPGFTLRGVVIHEDPAVGLEPFAYVGELEARVRLGGLLRRRLEFSTLRLDGASVNLVKTVQGHWNFQPLLSPSTAARLPSISVRGSRLNFTLGGVKSVFYFSNTDLDLGPSRPPGGPLSFEFSGVPTRSDRTARGFGAVRGRGNWRTSELGGGALDMQLELEKSSVGELVTLLHGHDLGVHGQLAGQATVRGPLSELEVRGTLDLSEIHRWDLLPPYARGGPLSFNGRLNLLSQDLQIETVPTEASSLSVRFRVQDYMVHPRWAVGVTVNGFSIVPLSEIARHMGVAFPDELKLDGAVSGALSYSPSGGFRGSASLDNASIQAPGSPPVRLESARLVVEGERVRLTQANIAVGDAEKATLQAGFHLAKQELDLRLATEGMSIAALQAEGGPLPGIPRPGFLSKLRGGTWSGWLRYQRQAQTAGAWAGALSLHETEVELPGLAQPLEVPTATVTLQDDRVDAEGEARAGELEVRGTYRGRPAGRRPHRLTLRLDKLTASAAEQLMAPTLARRRGFLSRTLHLSLGQLPEWLRNRHVEGTLDIGSLQLAGQTFEAVKLGFFWDGPVVEAPRFRARFSGGIVEGHLNLDLSGLTPMLRAAGRLDSATWRGGRLDGDAVIATSGTGDELYWNLRAEGSFRARAVELVEGRPVQGFTGLWSLRWERRRPKLELSDLRLADGQEVFIGYGATTEEDRLTINLARGDRRIHLAGTLKPLRLETAESR